MHRSISVAFIAAVLSILSVSGIAALGFRGGTPHYPGTPTRAHVALGSVGVLVGAPGDVAPAATLAETARARFGEVDALADIRATPLPSGGGSLVTATALRWR